MAKPIGEVIIKGKSIDEHAKSEEGRSLLRWIINQEIKDDTFKGWAIGRNKYIKEKLELYKDDVQVNEEAHKSTVLEVFANQIANHEKRIKDLEDFMVGPDMSTDEEERIGKTMDSEDGESCRL